MMGLSWQQHDALRIETRDIRQCQRGRLSSCGAMFVTAGRTPGVIPTEACPVVASIAATISPACPVLPSGNRPRRDMLRGACHITVDLELCISVECRAVVEESAM